MTLTANSSGVLTGRFMIPAGVKSGTKAVRATGAGGLSAVADYTARGQITTVQRRRVTTITTTMGGGEGGGGGGGGVDPLAQTFTLDTGRHIAAIDLWFSAKGDKDVIVQIRDTASGVPGSSVMAQKRIKTTDIANSGTATRITFDQPVWIGAGVEHAIVVMTDSATTALWLAEVGGFDAAAQRRITSQPYQIGVMLSSSNGQTWTPHQGADLAFRILACKFTSTTRTISLGSVSVADMSDMIAEVSIDIPATGASAEITATVPGGAVYRMTPDKPVQLPSRINGTVSLSLKLTGTSTASPVVYPGMQFVAGDVANSGSYAGRAFPVGTSARVSITLETYTPSTSNVTLWLRKDDNSLQLLSLTSASDVGDGWVERNYTVTGVTTTTARVVIASAGLPAGSNINRPRIRKLRAVATD